MDVADEQPGVNRDQHIWATELSATKTRAMGVLPFARNVKMITIAMHGARHVQDEAGVEFRVAHEDVGQPEHHERRHQ